MEKSWVAGVRVVRPQARGGTIAEGDLDVQRLRKYGDAPCDLRFRAFPPGAVG
jgi:hypothetical protein